ncbi:MAG: hypothetical protein JXR10_08565 [Cyclobacteriaceae bacterium]
MKAESLNLFHVPLNQLVDLIREGVPSFEYDFKKHLIRLLDEDHEELGHIRLPLHISLDKGLHINETVPFVLYMTIESGNAAICISEGKDISYHTTIGAYMTRKKQGFSQIKYLNKKGKSRAGSRVRLAGTITFFEEINETLGHLFIEYEFDRIALNCSTSLIPYLYQSKVSCPFEKDDHRLYKIPLHLPQSNYTNLNGAIKKLMAPMLNYQKKDTHKMHVFLESLAPLVKGMDE